MTVAGISAELRFLLQCTTCVLTYGYTHRSVYVTCALVYHARASRKTAMVPGILLSSHSHSRNTQGDEGIAHFFSSAPRVLRLQGHMEAVLGTRESPESGSSFFKSKAMQPLEHHGPWAAGSLIRRPSSSIGPSTAPVVSVPYFPTGPDSFDKIARYQYHHEPLDSACDPLRLNYLVSATARQASRVGRATPFSRDIRQEAALLPLTRTVRASYPFSLFPAIRTYIGDVPLILQRRASKSTTTPSSSIRLEPSPPSTSPTLLRPEWRLCHINGRPLPRSRLIPQQTMTKWRAVSCLPPQPLFWHLIPSAPLLQP